MSTDKTAPTERTEQPTLSPAILESMRRMLRQNSIPSQRHDPRAQEKLPHRGDHGGQPDPGSQREEIARQAHSLRSRARIGQRHHRHADTAQNGCRGLLASETDPNDRRATILAPTGKLIERAQRRWERLVDDPAPKPPALALAAPAARNDPAAAERQTRTAAVLRDALAALRPFAEMGEFCPPKGMVASRWRDQVYAARDVIAKAMRAT
jgi:hypothetical protein